MRQTSPSCASSARYCIQFYSYCLLKIPREEHQDHPNIGKTRVLFPLLLYYYRSWAAWAILYSISVHAVILNSLNGLYFPEPYEGLRYIITTVVLVCNWQHFLLIPIVINIPINKIINHHNQCIRCQSFVQPSTHYVAAQDSSNIFLEKGNKTTSKKRESLNRIKVKLPPFFLPDLLQYQHMRSSINSNQNAKKFLRTVSIQQPNFFPANVLHIICWKC